MDEPVTKRCVKPCASCPFRSDIEPWQHNEDVRKNVGWLRDPASNPICHETYDLVYLKVDGTRVFEGQQLRKCAGFLRMRAKLGLAGDKADPSEDSSNIFGSIEEFQQLGPCPDQSQDARCAAFNRNKARSLAVEGVEDRELTLAAEEADD